MSASTSAEVLTNSFDFNLHLEDEESKSYRYRRVSFIVTIFVMALVSLYLYHFRPVNLIGQLKKLIIPAVVDKNIDAASLDHVRLQPSLENIDDQLLSRIKTLESTIAMLGSKVSDIDGKKDFTTYQEELVSVKTEINSHLVILRDHIAIQTAAYDHIEEAQKTSRSDLEMLDTKMSLKEKKDLDAISDIKDKLQMLKNRIYLINKLQSSNIDKKIDIQPQVVTSTSVFLLEKIRLLEEKFEIAVEDITKKNMLKSSVDGGSENSGNTEYSNQFSQIESLVKKVWDENEKVYKESFIQPVCVSDVKQSSDKIEVTHILPSVPKDEVNSTVYEYQHPDYAMRSGGAHIVHRNTSMTYLHPEMSFKHVSNLLLDHSGINKRNNTLNNFLTKVVGSFSFLDIPTIHHLFGLDYIGSPEDAISSDMSLGSCWAMAGTKGFITIKLARPIIIHSISIDHVSRF